MYTYRFQSPRSGKFVSDVSVASNSAETLQTFQSPRSGKFVSDSNTTTIYVLKDTCFNPLDRGNLYQIEGNTFMVHCKLDRFQSPRSGKFVSDLSLP